MLIPRRALESVGLLDEDYFAYWEETDWCVRAREKGPALLLRPGGARSGTRRPARSRPATPFNFLYRRNALMFVRKRGGRSTWLTALAVHMLLLRARATSSTIRRRIGRALAELKALLWHAQ